MKTARPITRIEMIEGSLRCFIPLLACNCTIVGLDSVYLFDEPRV